MISFSGIDCGGKSTQIENLCKEFEKRSIRHQVVWSRGGYTPGIEAIKKLIRGKKTYSNEEFVKNSEIVHSNPKKHKILLYASLIDLWFYYSVVMRIKGIGKTIICDRYIWDTYIDFKIKYGEYDFENGFWWKLTLKTMAKPKYSFVLFITPEESMRRSGLKYEPFPEKIEIRKKRIDMYVDELKNNRWNTVVDAMVSADEVFSQICKTLNLD